MTHPKQGPEAIWTEMHNGDLNTQNAEKLHAQTSRGGSGDQNKDFLSRNCMSEMHPGSATGLTKVGNQAKPLKYSGKKVAFRTNLEQMFKRVATDLDTQSTTTQQRLTCALKDARLLPGGCCGINDKGNEIVFGINNSPTLTMIAGLDGADQWLGLRGHRTSHQWTISYGATLKP